jgi:hypothetical protein
MFAFERWLRIPSVARYSARLAILDSSSKKRMLSSPYMGSPSMVSWSDQEKRVVA